MLQSVVPDLYKQAWHPFFNICSTVMSNWPHGTLPRVLWIHATTVALKLSLFCVGSTSFLLPGLLGILSGCRDMKPYLLTSKGLTHALKKAAEVLWSAMGRYWSATWRYWSLLLGCSSLAAPPAGTAGCAAAGRGSRATRSPLAQQPVGPGGIMDQGREAADCCHWRWWWGGLGAWWGKEYSQPNQLVKPAFHVTAKKAFARHVGGSHDLETRHRWAQFFHWQWKHLLWGIKETRNHPCSSWGALRLSARYSAQLKNDSGVHWVE